MKTPSTARTNLYLVCLKKHVKMFGTSMEIYETRYVCTSLGDAESLRERHAPFAVINIAQTGTA